MRTLSIMLAVLLAGIPALAQEPGIDTIGLWFDVDAGINVMEAPPVGTAFSCYAVIHAPSHMQIGGFELGVVVPEGVLPYDMVVIPGGFQFGDGPTEMVVGFLDPHDGDPDLLVARIDCLIIAEVAMPAFFVLGPTDPTSFPETQSPGYAYWENGEVLLQALDYAFGDPAATRFEPGTVAVETRSLTAVKNLFD